jgi:antitoxin component YwqK of YwqJK toxin-antitoxin module
MEKLFLLPVITMFCLLNICRGQAYRFVYYFDQDLNSTKQSKAVVIGRGIKEDKLFRLDYFLGSKEGILFMSAHYIDSSLKIMQGEFTQFYKNGKVEDNGNYLNDQKNGLWQKWDSLGLKNDSTVYQDGNAVTSATFNYHKNGRLRYYTIKDSLADTYTSSSYDDKGVISSEVFFRGQSGILKRYDSGAVKVDSLFTREEREASFPGGQAGWIRYLQKNLNPLTPVNNGARRGTYQVIVKFIVAKDGAISDVTPETNHGYGMEKEVMRIIKNGPAWIPASQFGRSVNAYRRQPVTFVVE